ncbi:hypothetical protein KY284_012970 [Solanum tuberosum]|nr:hypothetical protein KY284_012970 [Solanum tuberosum]
MCALAEIWLGLTSLPEFTCENERKYVKGRGEGAGHRFERLAGVGTWGRLDGGDLIVSFELDGLLVSGGYLDVFARDGLVVDPWSFLGGDMVVLGSC